MAMLIGFEQTAGFLAAAVLVTLAPGPDNLMVLSLGMAKGRRPGIAFGLGCAAGCLSHTALAALGISALIAASDWAFLALKLCGGLYLLWLGFQALKNARAVGVPAQDSAHSAESPGALFLRGVLANAINPKVIIFFLAFLPQFVDVGRGAVGWQITLLGVIFTLQAAAIFGAIGYFAGHVGQWLAQKPSVGAWLDRVAGTIFVLLGLRLILSR